MRRIAILNVLEEAEGINVELWQNPAGRVFVRAYNDCGYRWTQIDLYALLTELGRERHDDGFKSA